MLKIVLYISLLLIIFNSCSKDNDNNDHTSFDFVGEWSFIDGYINAKGDTIYEYNYVDSEFIEFSQEPHKSKIISIIDKNKAETDLLLGEVLISIEKDGDVYPAYSPGFNNYATDKDCSQIESEAYDPNSGSSVKLRQLFNFYNDDLAYIICHTGIEGLCYRN